MKYLSMTAKRELVKPVAFLVVVFFLWHLFSRLVTYKESYYFKNDFYKNPGYYDVLFFGPSLPHSAFDPAVLWDEYGISSYNLAASGEAMNMTYFAVKSALEKSSPKVVIINDGRITDEIGKDYVSVPEAHKTLDCIPFGETKMNAIRYLINTGEIDDPIDFISNMWSYHNRITELNRYDFELRNSHGFGWNSSTAIEQQEPVVSYITERKKLNNGEGVKAYKEIVDLCKEKDTKLLLVSLPYNKMRYQRSAELFNSISDYTKEQGFESLNMNEHIDEIGIDYNYDFSGGSHLNIMGAKKTTRFIGKYLREHYSLSDKREQACASEIDKTREANADNIIQYLQYENNALSFILAAQDKYLSTEIFIKDRDCLDSIYGFNYVLEFFGINPKTAGADMFNDDSDMLINIYDIRNNGQSLPAVSKKFIYNDKKKWMTNDGNEAEVINYFP